MMDCTVNRKSHGCNDGIPVIRLFITTRTREPVDTCCATDPRSQKPNKCGCFTNSCGEPFIYPHLSLVLWVPPPTRAQRVGRGLLKLVGPVETGGSRQLQNHPHVIGVAPSD